MRAVIVVAVTGVVGASTLATASVASAASPTVAKRTVTTPAPKYWLSDGLNRLVFWQPPPASRTEHPVRQ